MSSLKRSNTMQTLKRSNTIQTLKRAGTGAWKWINAEDVNINQNHPQGVSYFQRSNTYKRLNSSNSMRRRPTRKQSQFSPQSYVGNNYPNSYSVNVNNGYNYPNQADTSYNYPNQANTSYSNNSYQYPNQSNSSYQYPNQSNSGYQYPNQSNSGYKYPNQSNSYKYPSQSNSYNGIKRPEPAAEKFEKENDMNKRKKDSKIPSVLYDPEVRKQLEQLKEHKPYFMYIATFLQIFFLLFTFYQNYTVTHRFIEPISDNPMIGPSSGVSVNLIIYFIKSKLLNLFNKIQ